MGAPMSVATGLSAVNAGRRPRQFLVAVMLAVPLSVASTPARAVDIKPLFNDLCQYHVLDSDTCSAKAVIDCLVQSGGSTNGMQQCAAQYDPEAQKFIAIYGAATKPDYVRLIELAGPVVACKLLPPGPPADILCGAAIRPIISQAFGKAAKIYGAASKGDWLTVIYVIGDPTVACAVVPSFPGKDITCGALAQTLVAGAKLVKQGAEAGIKALESGVQTLGNVALGGLESLGLGGAGVAPISTFDRYYVRPLLHQRALQGVMSSGKPFLGLDRKAVEACISHVSMGPINKAPSDFDIKSCEQKSQQLHDEATALANLVRVAPAAYFGNVNASASLLLATNFWNKKTDQFIGAFWFLPVPYESAAGIQPLPRQSWSAEGFQSLPSPFSAVLGNCYETTRAAFPVPLAPQLTGPLNPPSLWGWVCAQSGMRLAMAMSAERKRLTAQVIPQLTKTGCVLAKTGDQSLKFDCDNAPALVACHALLPDANPKSRCRRSANFQPPASVVMRRSDQPRIDPRAPQAAVDVPARPVTSQVVAPPGRLSAAVAAGLKARAVTIEAESLLASNLVKVAGGRVDVQPMAGFGPGWSGDAQLFWHGGAVGAVLDLLIEVPQDGAWIVEIDLTRAPDYGQLAFEMDQHAVAQPFDGYAPAVNAPVTLTLGTFAMRQGRRPLSLKIIGHHGASTGLLAGIDRIRLRHPGE